MKILFLTPCIPTQSDGRRPYNFLTYLAPRHEVHLLALKLPSQKPEDVRRIHEMGVRVTTVDYQTSRSVLNCILGIPRGRPFRTSWIQSPEYAQTLERMLTQNNYDIVHIDRMRMGYYAPLIQAPKLLDFTDSLVLYLERSLAYRKKRRDRFVDTWELKTIPRFERWLLKQVNASLVCSSVDAHRFKEFHPDYAFHVIENAVDSHRFQPRTHAPSYPPRCILTGTLFYFANVDSVLYYKNDILPMIRAKFPEMETQVIGTRPKRDIRKLNGKQGIQVLADVPNMADCLYQDDIYLCPLRVAAGVRNKLLEALSAGMPVITTPLGVEGMNVKEGREVLFAETPKEFVEQIQKVITSPELRRSLGEQGRRYVQENHHLDVLGKKLEDLYEKMMV